MTLEKPNPLSCISDLTTALANTALIIWLQAFLSTCILMMATQRLCFILIQGIRHQASLLIMRLLTATLQNFLLGKIQVACEYALGYSFMSLTLPRGAIVSSLIEKVVRTK